MLRVSNVAYNWADYLVTKCNFPPSQYDLQKIVARTSNDEKAATAKRKALGAIPSQYVPDFAEYIFHESVGMTQHKTVSGETVRERPQAMLRKKRGAKKKVSISNETRLYGGNARN
jgi:hypothetical protein